jgi:hypothetical protein
MKKLLFLFVGVLIGCSQTEMKEAAVLQPAKTPTQVVAECYEAMNKSDSNAYFACFTPDALKRVRMEAWKKPSENYDFKPTKERPAVDMPNQVFVEGEVKSFKPGSDSIVWSNKMVFELFNMDNQWKIAASRPAI